MTAFVHGVPHAFIKVGEAKAKAAKDGEAGFDQGAYFIGKVTRDAFPSMPLSSTLPGLNFRVCLPSRCFTCLWEQEKIITMKSL